MKKYCFGIDVGGTTVKCGLFLTSGQLLEKWEVKTDISDNGSHILSDIAKSLETKLREKEIEKDEIEGIGLGVPGPVDDDGIIATAVNLHWGQKDLPKEMYDLIGLKTYASNDANVAALGEMWMGGAKGHENLILVTLGTGVGGGIIVKGKVISGSHGAGGELGHSLAEPDEEEVCNCGNKGCLEQVASATGIVRLARKKLSCSHEKSKLDEGELSAKAIFDAYKEGDCLAAEVVEKFGYYLGSALSRFAVMTDPEVIVVGGGVSKAGQVLLDIIEKYYKKYAFSSCKNTPIVLAKLGNDAGIYGAARLVL